MHRYNKTDIRFFCELVLVETSPSSVLKNAFWQRVDAAKRSISLQSYINPRFMTGDRWITITGAIASEIPMTCTIFIDHKSRAIVVCFPGTNDNRQIAAFATILKEKMPWHTDLSAHKGFLKIYLLIAAEVMSNVQQMINLYPDYNLVLAGYSLGGTLCRLFLWHFHSIYPSSKSNVDVMTWGSPRVFPSNSAKYYSNTITTRQQMLTDTRYEMPGDRIVGLPPKWTGFEHVGERELMSLPDLREMNTVFERLFAGIHQSYIPNMRFTLINLLHIDNQRDDEEE